MHSFRFRYIVLGLLIYIQSAFCRTCGTDFDDLGSRTVAATVILEGSVRRVTTTDARTGRYNATLSVRKLLKGDLARKPSDNKKFNDIVVGVFGPDNKDECITEVGRGNKYIVFLQEPVRVPDNPVPFYPISSLPEKSSKKVTREVRKYNCDPQESCLKRPKGSLKPKRGRRTEGEPFKLQCKVKGSPAPIFSWLKDGAPLVTGRRIQVKGSKRGSVLRVKKLEVSDAGRYTCTATNVAGALTLDADLTVREEEEKTTLKTTPPATTTSTSRPPSGAVLCERQNYCLNDGACYRLENLGDRFCKCRDGFDGRRCESLADFDLIKKLESRQTHRTDRALTITGLVVAGLVLITLCIAAFIMARRRRSQFRKKLAKKRQRRDNMSNGNYRPSSTVDSPANQMELQPMIHTSPAGTQTDRFLLQSIINEMSVPQSQSSPQSSLPRQSSDILGSAPPHRSSHGSQGRNSRNSYPRQNAAPASASMPENLGSARGRLRGESRTPDIDRDQRQGNVSVVNAVVESDPEQPRSSPSQTSVTESAHEINDFPKMRGGKRDSGPTDDRSDYDYQASDLEVNMESEADLQELEDEVDHPQQGYRQQPDSSSDSTDTADTSSIEDSPEKALFAKMIAANPRVDSLQNKEDSDRDSPGHLSWDDYGNTPQYPYNPYDDDSDIIANRFLLNDNRPSHAAKANKVRQPDSRDKHLPAHERLLEPVDPDPDATVV